VGEVFWPGFEVARILLTRYDVIPQYLSDPALVDIQYEDLRSPVREKLRTIPSDNVNFVFVIVVNEFYSELELFKKSHDFVINANIEGFLIDKSEGEIIWLNSATAEGGEHMLNLILNCCGLTSTSSQVMKEAIRSLMIELPRLNPDGTYLIENF